MLRKPVLGIGIALGALIGGVGGLLMSPRNGQQNRKAVKDQVGKVKDRVDQVKDRVGRNHAQDDDEVEESLASRDADYLH